MKQARSQQHLGGVNALCGCSVLVLFGPPLGGRKEGLLEEHVNVDLARGGHQGPFQTLSLEALRSAQRGVDLIRLIVWHHLVCNAQLHIMQLPNKNESATSLQLQVCTFNEASTQ